MWSIAPLIATAAAISNGVGWAVLPVFMNGFGPLLIFLASFTVKDAYWKLTKFDYTCGIFSVLALILWAVTKDPNIAIIFAIISDGSASIPTIKKTWSHPESESPGVYAIGAFSGVSALLAARLGIFSEYAYPIYLILINLVVVLSMYKKKLQTIV